MGEINIIKIDGKPLEKLIDVISIGIGKLYQPKEIRKRADAEAYEIEVKEGARSRALGQSKMRATEIELKIQNRLNFKEMKRQHNIDNITYVAAEQLKDEKTVSQEKVDEDWITRFFNIVEDISNEEMQKLGGRILAGEVKQPNSYSIRTLEFLKNISKIEAELIQKVGKLKLLIGGRNFIYDINNGKFLEDNYGITYSDILTLREIGILSPTDSLLSFSDLSKGAIQEIIYGNKSIQISRSENGNEIKLYVITFTKPAMEILQLIQTEYHEDYIIEIAKLYEKENKELQYQIGDIKEMTNGQKEVVNLKEIFINNLE